MRYYNNDNFNVFDSSFAGAEVEWVESYGPLSRDSWMNRGGILTIEDDFDAERSKIDIGERVVLTGNFRLNVERDWDDDGMTVHEWEDAEIVLPSGRKAWVAWYEFEMMKLFSLPSGWSLVV